jgi:hypothetical protein
MFAQTFTQMFWGLSAPTLLVKGLGVLFQSLEFGLSPWYA